MLVVLILVVALASPVMAQYCMESDGYPKLIFDTSDQGCLSRPTIPRAYYPGLFKFHETNYLGMSDGNQLMVYGVDDPTTPNLLETSDYPVSHMGDSDYDLLARVMCDECRYAFFPYKIQGVFADLGDPATHAIPSFQNYVLDTSIQSVNGGFTFKSGSTQYLITKGLTDKCQGAGVFKFMSTDPATIAENFVSCLEDDSGVAVDVSGGLYLQDPAYNGGTPYLWLSDNYDVYVFRVDGSGDDVTLQYVRMLPDLYAYALGSHSLSMAVDLDQGMAVSLSLTHGLILWDFPDHDLSNPHQVLARSDVGGDLVAFEYPLVWTQDSHGYWDPHNTFRVTGAAANPSLEDIANPPGTDMSFWDFSQSWNDLPCGYGDFGAAFSPDGRNLYVARWEVAQNFDVSRCSSDTVFHSGFETGGFGEWSFTSP